MKKRWFHILRLAFFGSLVGWALLSTAVTAGVPVARVLHAEGVIVPVVADYIDRGISQAEAENATVCIIELDTPGGLLDSTEKIVKRIMNATVPVVVYVTPRGGWAASAGTFITLSGHVAAMTPGTTIGAAHPVAGGGEEIPEAQMQKIVEFSAKWMETIAQERGRNIEQAQLAVTESKSFSDTEALEFNLIDLRANSLEDLISQLNGRQVTLGSGATVTIDTAGYAVNRQEMSGVERFLHAISNPEIAYILLSVGSIGIIAEIYNPGTFFPGIIGAISLLLAFYSLNVLDARWGGALLILLAFGLFVAEMFTPGLGILTAGGIVSLILGSLILFPGGGPLFEIDPWLIAVVVIIIVGFFAFVIQRVTRAHRRQAASGREEMPGRTALSKTALDPEGVVLVEGERWTAVSEEGPIKPGEEVVINRVEGLKLYVSRKK